MPRAKRLGQDCHIRVTDDGNDNWSIEVAPVRERPIPSRSFMPDPAVLVVKLHADTREAAVRTALETLKTGRHIDDFTL